MATTVLQVKFDCICRICLKKGNEMLPLFETQEDNTYVSPCLVQKVTSIAQVQIASDDGLPDKICQHCQELVEKFFEFQSLIQKSDEKLHTYLNYAESNVESGIKIENLDDCDYFEISVKSNDYNNEEELAEVDTILVPSTDGLQVWKICSINKSDEDKIQLTEVSVDNVNKENLDNTVNNILELKEVVRPSVKDGQEIKTEQQLKDERCVQSRAKKTKVRRYHKCNKCEKMFSLAKELDSHMRKHVSEEKEENKFKSPDGKIKCQICLVEFQSLCELKNHVSVHFSMNLELAATVLKREETDKVIENLETTCLSKPKYKKRKFACSSCHKYFDTKAQQIVHNRNHTRNSSRHKKFQCSQCDKWFLKRSELRYHKGIHVESPPYCSYCNKNFQNMQSLKMHMKRHTLGSRYMCETCGKSYYTNSELARHIQQHAGKRDFPCTLCTESFLSKPELNRHLKYHRGDKKFKCSICSKSYFESGHLKIHQRTHTGEKPYSCDLCGKGFITKSKLARHAKIHFRTQSSSTFLVVENTDDD